MEPRMLGARIRALTDEPDTVSRPFASGSTRSINRASKSGSSGDCISAASVIAVRNCRSSAIVASSESFSGRRRAGS